METETILRQEFANATTETEAMRIENILTFRRMHLLYSAMLAELKAIRVELNDQKARGDQTQITSNNPAPSGAPLTTQDMLKQADDAVLNDLEGEEGPPAEE